MGLFYSEQLTFASSVHLFSSSTIKTMLCLFCSEKIGVFYCGPKCLSRVISTLCCRIKVNGNSLVFHKDGFG